MNTAHRAMEAESAVLRVIPNSFAASSPATSARTARNSAVVDGGARVTVAVDSPETIRAAADGARELPVGAEDQSRVDVAADLGDLAGKLVADDQPGLDFFTQRQLKSVAKSAKDGSFLCVLCVFLCVLCVKLGSCFTQRALS